MKVGYDGGLELEEAGDAYVYRMTLTKGAIFCQSKRHSEFDD